MILRFDPVFMEAAVLDLFELLGDAIDANGVAAECGVLGREPLAQQRLGLLRCRHAALEDHALGQPDGRLRVDVLTMDGVTVGEASAAGILDAPSPPGGRPLDLRPSLAADGQNVEGNLLVWVKLGLNDTVAASVGTCRRHRHLSIFPLWIKIDLSKCHSVTSADACGTSRDFGGVTTGVRDTFEKCRRLAWLLSL
jgi:hypothetical protein